MRVFNTCFKVIQKNLPQIMIYFFVFLLLAVVLSNIVPTSSSQTFASTQTRVAFFNDDTDSPLTQGLKDYLSKNSVLVSIDDTLQSRQDALFYQDVQYIVRVPAGFSQSFLSGSDAVSLERTAVSGSSAGTYMDFLVNRYFSLAKMYRGVSGITPAQITDRVTDSLSVQSKASVHSFGTVAETQKATYYFVYLAYALMAIMILGVTSILMVFNNADLRRRNLCSPVNLFSINLQLVLGNLMFTLVVWALMFGIGIAMYARVMVLQTIFLYGLNLLVFTLVCLCTAFLCGTLIKSHGAQSALANVLSLGTCFISGVFVPQDMLGGTVKTIASFTPTYWYVRAVNDLNGLKVIGSSQMHSVSLGILIQLGFAAALLAVALVVAKQKRTGEDSSIEQEEE